MPKLHPHRSNHIRPRLLAVALATTFSAVLTLGSTQAQVSVPATVAFDNGTGIYTYSYSVVNNGPTFDLALINVPLDPISNPLNFTSPSGFEISFDPGLGIVSFFEDTDPGTLSTFAPSTTHGFFTFTSPQAPSSVIFDALDANGDTFTGSTMSPVPEPGTLALLGATLLAPAFFARRRRNATSSPITNPTHN